MENYCLTAEEILYLAAVAGADTFYGVPDTLSGLSDQELGLKVVEMEDSLAGKGYLTEDFDGNKNVMPKLVGMIRLCGNCERFLCLEKIKVGEPQKALMYFMNGDSAYKMECVKGQYLFSGTELLEIRQETERELAIRETEKKDESNFLISYEELGKAVTLARRGSADQGMEILKAAGASDDAAQTVADGIMNKTNFYALLFMDFGDETNPGYSLQYLSGDMLVVMEYEAEEDDQIRFLEVDHTELKEKLEAGFKKVRCAEREEMFA